MSDRLIRFDPDTLSGALVLDSDSGCIVTTDWLETAATISLFSDTLSMFQMAVLGTVEFEDYA